jgi:polyisoprenyl-phosphate glycosyltransferase
MISLVIPCFNEEAVLHAFYDELTDVFVTHPNDYEFIFVNDGSTDSTLDILKKIAHQDRKVHYISFSRNFGKEAAMLAGLHFAQGEAVIIMDADLQHPPSLIPDMIQHYENGYDQVIAKRNRKGESVTRSILSRIYYRLMNQFVDITLVSGLGDFRLLSRRAVHALLSLKENNRFSKGLFSWIGFKEQIITYENRSREMGKSKWSFSKLLNYGMDGVISFNHKPLRASIYMGFIVTLAATLYVLFIFIQTLLYGVGVPGYFTIISSILLIGGIQLIFLGVIGEYIGRIYYECKQRPHYIIAEENVTGGRRHDA